MYGICGMSWKDQSIAHSSLKDAVEGKGERAEKRAGSKGPVKEAHARCTLSVLRCGASDKCLVHSPNANSEKRSETQIKGSVFGFLEDGR